MQITRPTDNLPVNFLLDPCIREIAYIAVSATRGMLTRPPRGKLTRARRSGYRATKSPAITRHTTPAMLKGVIATAEISMLSTKNCASNGFSCGRRSSPNMTPPNSRVARAVSSAICQRWISSAGSLSIQAGMNSKVPAISSTTERKPANSANASARLLLLLTDFSFIVTMMYNSFLYGTAVLFSYYFFYLVIIVLPERLLIVTKIVTIGEKMCLSNYLLPNRSSPLHQEQSKCNLLSVSETFHALRLPGI